MAAALMLSTAALEAAAAGFTFWPGWTFRVFESEHEGPWVRIEVATTDGYRMSEPTTLGIDSPLPPFETGDEFARWMLWRCERVCAHEAREGFRYRGVLVSDPHSTDVWDGRRS